MNTTQTILLSTGILLTTATTATLSYTFLANNNGPLPVEAQRDTGEVQLVRTPVEPQITEVKTQTGKTVRYTRDNIHMTQEGIHIVIRLNGTITDLTGETTHFSQEENCYWLGGEYTEPHYTNEDTVACVQGRKVFQF